MLRKVSAVMGRSVNREDVPLGSALRISSRQTGLFFTFRWIMTICLLYAGCVFKPAYGEILRCRFRNYAG